MTDRPGTDTSHELQWRHGDEWDKQGDDPDYGPLQKESKITDRVDSRVVEMLLKRLTFEAVNGEIDRTFAGNIGTALRALLAERDMLEAESEGAAAIIAAERVEVLRLREENRRMLDAGQAVVDRWDTPLWKEAEATGHVINRLRAALAEQEKTDGQ